MAIDDRKLYESKDVKRILGVKPEEIYLWSRTWGLFEPAIRGKAHGKNRYSLENLMQIALIKELLQWQIGLAAIQRILPAGGEQRDPSIWRHIGASRERFEREGCVFALHKSLVGPRYLFGNITAADAGILPQIISLKWALDDFKSFCFGGDGNTPLNFGGILMIDLMKIIYDVESATGDKLGDSP